MLYTYKELISKGLKRYEIEQKTKNNDFIKVAKGIYSDKKSPDELSIVMKKYPKSILTLQSAFYYYNLTSKRPKHYFLATDKKAHIIDDSNINQIFTTNKLLRIGETHSSIEDTPFSIYDKERLLIELIRYRTKLPHDLYKEVLNNYKKMQDSLNIVNLYKYTKVFNQPYIIKTIISEIL